MISALSRSLGIYNGFCQTKQQDEKGKVIKKESQEFKLKFFEDQKPQVIIGVFVALAILIIPSETFSFGPLGPSGVIPTYSFSLILLKIILIALSFFLKELGMLFKLKYFPI